MKEASGEANLTVITIILIAVVVAVATPLVNSLMHTSAQRACCTDAGGVWKDNKCQAVSGSGSYSEMSGYWDETNNTCSNSSK